MALCCVRQSRTLHELPSVGGSGIWSLRTPLGRIGPIVVRGRLTVIDADNSGIHATSLVFMGDLLPFLVRLLLIGFLVLDRIETLGHSS